MRLPLPPIADNAALFLWHLASMQTDALAVAEAWGFRVVSEIVWQKLSKHGRPWFGMGRTVRASHETALVCLRGPASALIRSRSIRSTFAAPVPTYGPGHPCVGQGRRSTSSAGRSWIAAVGNDAVRVSMEAAMLGSSPDRCPEYQHGIFRRIRSEQRPTDRCRRTNRRWHIPPQHVIGKPNTRDLEKRREQDAGAGNLHEDEAWQALARREGFNDLVLWRDTAPDETVFLSCEEDG